MRVPFRVELCLKIFGFNFVWVCSTLISKIRLLTVKKDKKKRFLALNRKYFRYSFDIPTRRCRIIHWSFWYQYWTFNSAPSKLLFYTLTWPYATNFDIKRQHCQSSFRWLYIYIYWIFSVPDHKNSFCVINHCGHIFIFLNDDSIYFKVNYSCRGFH